MDKINKQFLTIATLLILGCLFVLINIYSKAFLSVLRFDLTDNKIYTLSRGSKQIIAEIKEPILLRYYFSKKLAKNNPYFLSFADRVKALLEQYKANSNGKILLEIIDPEPFSEMEDEAVNYGLEGVSIDNEGNELYFGLVGTNSTVERQVIPFFNPNKEESLEYDITQLIYNLTNITPKVVGIISSDMNQNLASDWMIYQQIASKFQIKHLSCDIKVVPANITVLMLVNPTNLTKDAVEAINNYTKNGGHVLAFVDPYSDVALARMTEIEHLEHNDNLQLLLSLWGIELEKNKVVAARELGRQVRFTKDGKSQTAIYPLWLELVKDNFNKQDILTGSLERLTLATPGHIKAINNSNNNSKITIIPLIKTNKDAMLVDTDNINIYKNNPQSLIYSYEPSGQEFVLAARVASQVAPQIAQGNNLNIILVADADMLYDHFWLHTQEVFGQQYMVPISGNGNFVLNALDNLCGSDALINIRNQGTFLRPFERINALERRSQEKYLSTEKLLLEKIELTKKKLLELEQQKEQAANLLKNINTKHEEDVFRQELIEARAKLREVRRQLRQDIENLEIKIKFFTIWLLPLLILLSGIIFWIRQYRYDKIEIN